MLSLYFFEGLILTKFSYFILLYQKYLEFFYIFGIQIKIFDVNSVIFIFTTFE